MTSIPKKRKAQNTPQLETRVEWLASNCGLLVIGLFTLTFIFQNFMIPSSSMASTLLVGDHVIVDRAMLAPRPHWLPIMPYRNVGRGDVVVFYKPVLESNGEHIFLVKRVVGIPGDRIHLRNGIVFLNGVAQNEPQPAKPTADIYDPYVEDFPAIPPDGQPGVTATWSLLLPQSIQNGNLVVPPNQYFVMGDNRDHSLDSRFWGFVPRENMIGRPLLVFWSFESAENDELKPSLSEQISSTAYEALHFFDKTRWTRTLHQVQ